MKKKLLLVIFALVCVSCSHSLEEKANALIEVDLKKSLYHPETYNPAETVVDSAFTPFDDPIFYEKTITLCKLGVEIEDYERKIKDEKSDMAFHKDMLQIMYSNSEKESYNQAKENYEKYFEEKEKTEQKIEKLVDELKSELEKEPQFLGFKARHSYRAQNNGGQVVFGEAKYLFDKDITQIVSVYDMDGDEYKAVQTVYKQMLGDD